MIPWYFSCDLLGHYGKAICVYSKCIMRLDPRFDNSAVALYYSLLRFVFLDFFATAQTLFLWFWIVLFSVLEIVGVKHQLFRHQKLRLIHAHASCSAVVALYLTKPITAKGAAPRIYTKLSVSIPKYGRRIKYSPIATLQASKKRTTAVTVQKTYSPCNCGFPYLS